jgi:PKD repeat protein
LFETETLPFLFVPLRFLKLYLLCLRSWLVLPSYLHFPKWKLPNQPTNPIYRFKMISIMKKLLHHPRLANKSSLMFLLLTLFSTALLRGQVSGDYQSSASGTLAAGAAIWETYSGGAWTATTTQPGSTNNVTIRNGHTITLSATSSFKNLTIDAGGTLTGNSAVRIYGTTFLVNGATTPTGTNFILEPSATTGANTVTVTTTNNTTFSFARIRPNSNDITMVVDMNTALTGTGGYVVNANGKTNFTFKVNAGKTVTCAATGYIAASTTGANDPSAGATNFILDIAGTLTTTDNATSATNVNLRNTAGNTTTLIVRTGAVLNIGGSLLAPSAGAGTAVVTVETGGTINFTGTAAASGQCDISKATATIDGTINFNNTSTSVRSLGTATVGGTLKLKDNSFPPIGATGTTTLNTGSTVEYYGSTTYALLAAPMDYKNLVINNSAHLTLGGGINVAGDLTVTAGTLTGNTVTLNGNTLQNLNGNGNAIGALTINNAAGVKLLSAATLQTLTFTNGNLTLDNYNLTVSSAVTGGSMTSHIVTNGTGSLKREVGSSALEFPVGVSASSYDPATLTNTGTTDTFSVRVDTILANPPSNGANVLKREWNLAETVAGGSTVAATFRISPSALNLNNGSFVAGAVTIAVPAMANNTWSPITTTFATPNATTTGLTTLNAFILANLNAFGVQPVAGTAAAVSTNLCIGSGTQLSITGAVGDTLQWQSSTDSVVWANTNAAGANGFTATPSVSTYYRFRAATNLGVAFSNVVKLTVNPKPIPNFTFAATGGQVVFTNTSTNGNTYVWRFGDAAASTSQVANPTFTYLSNGTYTVWLRTTSAAGCVDSTSKIVAVTRVGLDETRLLYGVKVYPNPVQTVLNVEMTQIPTDVAELVILDALGKVKHIETVSRHTQIAVNEWSAGIYWMAVRRGGTLQLLDKILIQN